MEIRTTTRGTFGAVSRKVISSIKDEGHSETVMLKPEHRKTIDTLYQVSRPWFDTRSYRPLLMLFVVSMAVFLGPLAWEVAVCALLWDSQRHSQCTRPGNHPGVAGSRAAQALCVKSTDSWPTEQDPDTDLSPRLDARWLSWALRFAVLSLALPIMRHPDGLGFADWDFVLDKFEALRRTILIWGQFPWWNPWSRGGFPLAAEPQIGAVSLATPLVLALGTSIGLRLAAIICLLLAVEGTYRLALLWLREPWGAAATALIYGLNGAVILATSLGYVLAMSYCSVPWLAYFACRIGRRFRDGLWLGFWMGFVVMNGIQYITLYAAPLTAMIWGRSLRLQPRERRRAILIHTLAALGVCLLICGWRLVTILLVILDDNASASRSGMKRHSRCSTTCSFVPGRTGPVTSAPPRGRCSATCRAM